jgi:hypothetical protein
MGKVEKRRLPRTATSLTHSNSAQGSCRHIHSSKLSCFDQMTVPSVAYTDWTDDASANPRQ